jgi:hypothetical protein
MEEKYPPGTQVERLNPMTNMLLAGTVMDIPFPLDVSASNGNKPYCPYMVLFDNGTTGLILLSKMATVIPLLPVQVSSPDNQDALLPPFLCLNLRITYKNEGRYHKGYLTQWDGVFWFSYASHVNKRKEDWGVPLPNLPTT